jgi:hypothetical protein
MFCFVSFRFLIFVPQTPTKAKWSQQDSAIQGKDFIGQRTFFVIIQSAKMTL